ncbi:hypothetical protein [Deinococcus marmoris]|uniref:Uncharacterized protein n=1 Tax=Deinococcus marmoris TaxID=249408 RepID=A0A1U7NYF4_9DEIO|nr:hypothetical protein [Deinococcus marmoris]OLV17953.1 hypothetical protein BOO71_0006916 [Deinococcus marmoris]
MLRASFWLTALLFIPLGLLLYFLPPALAATLGVSPLWLPRFAGGLLLAWGAFQVAAGFEPDAVRVGGLAGGNLLTVAALLPAALRGDALPPAVRTLMLALSGALLLLAVVALLAVPSRRRPSAKVEQ